MCLQRRKNKTKHSFHMFVLNSVAVMCLHRTKSEASLVAGGGEAGNANLPLDKPTSMERHEERKDIKVKGINFGQGKVCENCLLLLFELEKKGRGGTRITQQLCCLHSLVHVCRAQSQAVL